MRMNLLKIQYGDIYVQLPDDVKDLDLVIDVLEWYKKRKGEGDLETK